MEILSFNIKKAAVEDVSSIRQIAVFTWWSVYPAILSAKQIEYMLEMMYSEKVLRRMILEKEQVFIILLEDEIPEAFAAYSFDEHNAELIKLQKIYILPQKQSKGFGRALISKVVNIAKMEGKRILELNVNRENPARFFYEKLGFKIIKEVDIPIGPYWMNDYIMRLDILKDWKY